MIDPHQKMLPALIHKNVLNDFAINAYNFNREVQVNTFRPLLRPSLLDSTAREVQKRLNNAEEVDNQFISCLTIPVKMKVVQCQEGVEIRSQPSKKKIYTSGITLQRRFEFEVHPIIEILASDDNNNSSEEYNRNIIFTSTVTIEAH